jgi:O-succinylbenzoic acid--CoA ligase
MDETLPDWLARRAAINPHHPALIAGGLTWSFGELDARAMVAARRLAGAGAREGQRVALLLRNSPTFVALIHAAPRAGAVLLPLNTRLSAPELAWQLADAGAHLLIYDAAGAAMADQLGALLPSLRLVRAEPHTPGRAPLLDELPEAELAPHPTINLAADHTLIYTSGTTGRPKGALLTSGNHWWSAVGSALNLGLHAQDRWMAPLPLFHVGGLAIALRCAIYGIPVVLPDSSDAAALNRALELHQVSIVSVVAALLQRMLDQRGQRPFPPSLRCVLLGGGPAPRPLLERCAALAVPVVQTYGLTEAASQVVTLAPADALRKLGSSGMPLLPNQIQIALEDGRPAPAGQVGEILVRGPSVMRGYLNAPEASARALRDGWLHTGDLGYCDGEGYLYVVDRRDDLIISGGENIYPAEVEEVLLAHPAVAEAGVVGVPDAQWGQVPVACVVLRPGAGASGEELTAFCAARLARYKIPRRIAFYPSLPRNSSGKLMRRRLLGHLAEHTGETAPI